LFGLAGIKFQSCNFGGRTDFKQVNRSWEKQTKLSKIVYFGQIPSKIIIRPRKTKKKMCRRPRFEVRSRFEVHLKIKQTLVLSRNLISSRGA